MIPIPPTRKHKTLFNSANDKKVLSLRYSDVQCVGLYRLHQRMLYETFNEALSVLRKWITLRNWSHMILCKDEKFPRRTFGLVLNHPRHSTALSCVDSSALRRILLLWLRITQQKRNCWLLYLSLRSRKQPLQYWISSSATRRHTLGKSNVNFHSYDKQTIFFNFNYTQYINQRKSLYSAVFKFCILRIRIKWEGHV